MRILVRMRVSVVFMRLLVARGRVRLGASACAVFDGLENDV